MKYARLLVLLSLCLPACLFAGQDQATFAIQGRPFSVSLSPMKTTVFLALIVPQTNHVALVGPIDCSNATYCDKDSLLGTCSKSSVTSTSGGVTTVTWSCNDSHTADCWLATGYIDGIAEAKLTADTLARGPSCLY